MKKGTSWSVQCFSEGCYLKLCSEKKDILLMEEILHQLICSLSLIYIGLIFRIKLLWPAKPKDRCYILLRFRMCFQKSKVPLNFWGAKWDHLFPLPLTYPIVSLPTHLFFPMKHDRTRKSSLEKDSNLSNLSLLVEGFNFQPIWRILVELDLISPNWGEKLKKCLSQLGNCFLRFISTKFRPKVVHLSKRSKKLEKHLEDGLPVR